MSNDKHLSNGHAPEAQTPSQGASAIRMRRAKERKARGAVVIRGIVVERDLISDLVQLGWVHALESQNASAVEHGLVALIVQALSCDMRPVQHGKAYVPVGLDCIEAVWPWAKPGDPINAETAGRALGTSVKCAVQVGFGPQEYAARAREMAGIA